MSNNTDDTMRLLWRGESCDGRGPMQIVGVTKSADVAAEFLRRCDDGAPYVWGRVDTVRVVKMEDLPR